MRGDDLGIDVATWARIESAGRAPGPRYWTAHCGGRPLSPHDVWGGGDRSSADCPRHRSGAARAWTRFWPDAVLARSVGSTVRTAVIDPLDGVWKLRLQTDAGARVFTYDAAHRMLAASLGWDALPSPADAVARAPGGFRARGVGLGHRVGLCLGAEAPVGRLE
jgi:hypothetical protein